MHSFLRSFFLGILGNYFQVPAKKRNSCPFSFFSKGNFPEISFCRNYDPAKTCILFNPSHQNVTIPQHVDQKQVKDVTHNNTTRNKESLLLLSSAAPLICCPLHFAESFSWCIHLSLFHCAPLVWLVVVLPSGLPPPLSRWLHLLSHLPLVGCHVASRQDACASCCPSDNL